MKKWIALALVLIMAVSVVVGCDKSDTVNEPTESKPIQTIPGEQPSSENLKVAAIFSGTITDGDWNESQYDGLKVIEKTGVEINFVENMSETDAAQAARDFASTGYNLIFLGSNHYQDHCLPVAASFPDVIFVCINGTIVQDNFISMHIADEEQGFLMGAISALLTESGKVGLVAGPEIISFKRGAFGFQEGVDYINEKYGLNVQASRIHLKSFTDVNEAKEIAISLIEDGCDVVSPMASGAGVGVMEAVSEKGIATIASGLGLATLAPNDTQITIVKDVGVAYNVAFELFKKNGLRNVSEVETYGVNNGTVYAAEWNFEPSDTVREKVDALIEAMSAEEITIDLNLMS